MGIEGFLSLKIARKCSMYRRSLMQRGPKTSCSGEWVLVPVSLESLCPWVNGIITATFVSYRLPRINFVAHQDLE